MSLTYGFFNAINHDRRYNAEQMSAIFDGIIHDGVFDAIGGRLMVRPGTGLGVIVATGRAWFDHTWTCNDADLPVALPAAELTSTRIDAVVLEVNHSDGVRANSIKVVKGTPAANPVSPQLTATKDVHQHPLAYITVRPKAESITAGDIKNAVGTAETPFVTGILETTSIDALFQAWQEDFDGWFENLTNILDGNAAGHLQNQITMLPNSMEPVGSIRATVRTDLGKAWLPCDGRLCGKDRALYNVLPKIDPMKDTSWKSYTAPCPMIQHLYKDGKWYFAYGSGNAIRLRSAASLNGPFSTETELVTLNNLGYGLLDFIHWNGYFILLYQNTLPDDLNTPRIFVAYAKTPTVRFQTKELGKGYGGALAANRNGIYAAFTTYSSVTQNRTAHIYRAAAPGSDWTEIAYYETTTAGFRNIELAVNDTHFMALMTFDQKKTELYYGSSSDAERRYANGAGFSCDSAALLSDANGLYCVSNHYWGPDLNGDNHYDTSNRFLTKNADSFQTVTGTGITEPIHTAWTDPDTGWFYFMGDRRLYRARTLLSGAINPEMFEMAKLPSALPSTGSLSGGKAVFADGAVLIDAGGQSGVLCDKYLPRIERSGSASAWIKADGETAPPMGDMEAWILDKIPDEDIDGMMSGM